MSVEQVSGLRGKGDMDVTSFAALWWRSGLDLEQVILRSQADNGAVAQVFNPFDAGREPGIGDLKVAGANAERDVLRRCRLGGDRKRHPEERHRIAGPAGGSRFICGVPRTPRACRRLRAP